MAASNPPTTGTTTTSPVEVRDQLAIDGGTPVANESIPFVSTALAEDEVEAAIAVLRSGMLRQGPECRQFEEEFATATDAKFALTTSNGTTALQLAYEALIQPGDEVLCPGYTFIATASMIIARGATPVLCEVDPTTFNIDVADAERRITAKTTAIAPVHLYGHPADIDAIQDLAARHDLRVIYDAAQSHLSRFNERGLGAYGDAVTYSFYPTKNMTTGEGGMITTNDEDLAARLACIRDHGMDPTERYHHVELGYNYRLNDVAASIGRHQLRKLPEKTQARQGNAARLTEGLSGVEAVICPTVDPRASHIFHQYTIRLVLDRLTCDRDQFVKALQAEGVSCAVHYPRALTEQPVIQDRVSGVESLPGCESLAREVICLPIHHALTESHLGQIVQGVKRVARAYSR